MNRRGFFGLLGKISALAVGAKVLPFAVPAQYPRGGDTVVFNMAPVSSSWSIGPNWGGGKTFTWKGAAGAAASWADPKNWSVS